MKNKLKGQIVSDKQDKTVASRFHGLKSIPVTEKGTKSIKNTKHTIPKIAIKRVNEVIIEEIKPISKDKKWKVIEKVS